MNNKELDNYLRQFYAEARTKDGELYSRSSLLGIRNAIERYLNNPPLNRGISITKGIEFQASIKQAPTKSDKVKQARKQRKYQTQTSHSRSRPSKVEILQCNPGRQSLGSSAQCLASYFKPVLVSSRTRRSTRTNKTKLPVLDGRERARICFNDPRRGHEEPPRGN